MAQSSSKSQLTTSTTNKSQAKMLPTERVFKYVLTLIIILLIICIKGFAQFRDYCTSNDLYSFRYQSLKWCGCSFLIIFITKYGYFAINRKNVEKIILPSYTGELRQKKIKAVLKLSYDFFFYSVTTIWGFTLFHGEYWFPSVAGGQGLCKSIYNEYPNWPSAQRQSIQIYYMCQLGAHLFSVFEVLFIRRKQQSKYYEWLLHHSLAVNLILLSMMSNLVAIGMVIMITHDLSDIIASGSRACVETIYMNNIFVQVISYLLLLFFWIYMRTIVYPFCVITQIYNNVPKETDSWNFLYYHYLYLLIMAVILFFMHLFWTYFLIKAGMKALQSKKSIVNTHEKYSEIDSKQK